MSNVNTEYYKRRAHRILDDVLGRIDGLSGLLNEEDPSTWGPFIAIFNETGSKLEQLVETYNKELEGKL